jgi:HlyD family secretion protein
MKRLSVRLSVRLSSTLLLIAVLLVVATIAGCGARPRPGGESAAAPETAQVRRGTLTARVSASGSVEPNRRIALTFKAAGEVEEVYVETGDEVKVGDPLVKLKTDELELQQAQARAALAAAEAQLAQLKASAKPEDVAAAEASLNSAQTRLDDLRAGPDDAELQAAQAAANSAWQNYNQVRKGPTQFELDKAKRNLDNARNQLYSAQSNRDAVCGRAGSDSGIPGISGTTQAQCDQAQAQVLIAQVNVDQAAAAQEELKAQPSDAALAQAWAQVAQAESQLKGLQEGAGSGEIAAAEAQVAQAQAQLDKLREGPTSEELAVTAAQLEQARVGVQQAELALRNATLHAPTAGTVSTVSATAGELISAAQPAVVLIDTSQYKITLPIDETDIGQIAAGQPARITLDAYPDRELTGEVTEISPSGTVQQGIVTYSVVVRPDETDLPLRPGMTAGVDITTAEKENVLLVPNRAIRSQNGRRVVLVQHGDTTEPVEVETGLRNDEFVEIVAGLSEGDRVVTSVVPTNQPLEGGFFGGQ